MASKTTPPGTGVVMTKSQVTPPTAEGGVRSKAKLLTDVSKGCQSRVTNTEVQVTEEISSSPTGGGAARSQEDTPTVGRVSDKSRGTPNLGVVSRKRRATLTGKGKTRSKPSTLTDEGVARSGKTTPVKTGVASKTAPPEAGEVKSQNSGEPRGGGHTTSKSHKPNKPRDTPTPRGVAQSHPPKGRGK